jgi:hypothetical protein
VILPQLAGAVVLGVEGRPLDEPPDGLGPGDLRPADHQQLPGVKTNQIKNVLDAFTPVSPI